RGGVDGRCSDVWLPHPDISGLPARRIRTATSTPIRASDRDLRALASIVSQDRPDLADGEGLPPSLLADLISQIRCDALTLDGWDTGQQTVWFSQEIPSG